MKKITAIIMSAILALSALVLVACGGGSSEDLSDSKYVGTWKATSMTVLDTTEEVSGGEYALTLNGDGTGHFFSKEDGGEGETTDITWELMDGGFKTKGDTKLKFKDDGNNIKAKILGVDLIFEKQ